MKPKGVQYFVLICILAVLYNKLIHLAVNHSLPANVAEHKVLLEAHDRAGQFMIEQIRTGQMGTASH